MSLLDLPKPISLPGVYRQVKGGINTGETVKVRRKIARPVLIDAELKAQRLRQIVQTHRRRLENSADPEAARERRRAKEQRRKERDPEGYAAKRREYERMVKAADPQGYLKAHREASQRYRDRNKALLAQKRKEKRLSDLDAARAKDRERAARWRATVKANPELMEKKREYEREYRRRQRAARKEESMAGKSGPCQRENRQASAGATERFPGVSEE